MSSYLGNYGQAQVQKQEAPDLLLQQGPSDTVSR